MQNLLREKLKLSFSKEVIDIVQFGSSVLAESNPNDIDIAVIFKKITLKEQLKESQIIKRQLEKHFTLPIHIKAYDFESFFDNGNFAKEGILFYGNSLIFNREFSLLFGLMPKVHVSYSLGKLKKKDKVRFNYLLSGKGGEYGLLRRFGGKILNPGLVEVPPMYEGIFIKSIKEIINTFEIKHVYIQGS